MWKAQDKIISMDRVKVSEIVDFWERDLYQVSDVVMEILKESLEGDNKKIRKVEDLRDILADYILYELEVDLYDAFPEEAFYEFGDGNSFVVETEEGDIEVDEQNYKEVIPDLIERELAKRYSEENGLLALAKDLAISTIVVYEDELKKLFKEVKYKRVARQEAERILQSLEAGEIMVSDIEDFEKFLQEHLANHLKEKFPKASTKLINQVAIDVAKSIVEKNEKWIAETILTLIRRQTIQNMQGIIL